VIENLVFSVVGPVSSSHSNRRSVPNTYSRRAETRTRVKPPREVSLRVKFIRLGEVSSIHNLHSFILPSHEKDQYIT
jgi:hypothetical protein